VKELIGFAHLGTVYVRDVMGRPNPTVGLLNIGEEAEKETPCRARPTVR
jgi:fatty acid/phospholipid biosynthesis enzyme